MFWDRVAWAYDIFANVMNRKANRALCAEVANWIFPSDTVLECACGTGLLTGVIAPRCHSLVATDFSAKMLKRAKKKCGKYGNVKFEQADILHLDYPDACFDTVVAANVIHLLEEPYRALRELERVCKPDGTILLPTYMNQTDKGTTNRASDAIGKMGVDFKRAFTFDTYKRFLADAGYPDIDCVLCEGRIPCAVAVLSKRTMQAHGHTFFAILSMKRRLILHGSHCFTGNVGKRPNSGCDFKCRKGSNHMRLLPFGYSEMDFAEFALCIGPDISHLEVRAYLIKSFAAVLPHDDPDSDSERDRSKHICREMDKQIETGEGDQRRQRNGSKGKAAVGGS